MGFLRFSNVRKIEGEGMTLEKYLNQIRYLYPNLPEMYLRYLRLVYEFNADQLERLIGLGADDIADGILTAFTDSLHTIKATDPAAFNRFTDSLYYRERMIDLFDIPTVLNANVVAYVEQQETGAWVEEIAFQFKQKYSNVISVNTSHPYLNYELLQDVDGFYIGIQILMNADYNNGESISVFVLCGVNDNG